MSTTNPHQRSGYTMVSWISWALLLVAAAVVVRHSTVTGVCLLVLAIVEACLMLVPVGNRGTVPREEAPVVQPVGRRPFIESDELLPEEYPVYLR